MIRRPGVLENKLDIHNAGTSYDLRTKCVRKHIHIHLPLGLLIKLQLE